MPEFVKVATIDEIPVGSAKLIEVKGNEIALFNIGGTLHAIDNSCTHVGGPLCEGEISGADVTCPWHGAVFDLTTGRAVGPPAFEAVNRYEVRVEGPDVQIEI
ncbi:MAG TPA: non-heme iron oxygenase ferredoxin subunit [Pyrinomonadaceae bacterium]|nr:non-heme iron oxygenase ferredoxin subunit [Pyrinomonadaceae bacterium]